jgi:hypothetical protein
LGKAINSWVTNEVKSMGVLAGGSLLVTEVPEIMLGLFPPVSRK